MATLLHNHCATHPHREAAARCPACGKDYCRECISEHEGRLLCATCLREQFTEAEAPRRSWGWLRRTGEALAGLLLLWLVFFAAGRILVATPTATHEYLFYRITNMMDWPEEEQH